MPCLLLPMPEPLMLMLKRADVPEGYVFEYARHRAHMPPSSSAAAARPSATEQQYMTVQRPPTECWYARRSDGNGNVTTAPPEFFFFFFFFFFSRCKTSSAKERQNVEDRARHGSPQRQQKTPPETSRSDISAHSTSRSSHHVKR